MIGCVDWDVEDHGDTIRYFNGIYEGNGYLIRLNLNYPDSTDIALFKYIKNATITNVITTGRINAYYF